jgi:tetratricopeptide (TPR) repeat protein
MPTGEDLDVAFGKFLIARGIASSEQVRENYQRLLDYRTTLGSQVNLAQVLARHDVASKERLRDAFQEFSGAPVSPSREAKPFGFRTVELPPGEQPDAGTSFSPIDTFESGNLGPGIGIPPTIDPEGDYRAPLGIPATIDPEGPGSVFGTDPGTARTPGFQAPGPSPFDLEPTVIGGSGPGSQFETRPGSQHNRGGPGGTHRMQGPGGTHAQSGGSRAQSGGLFDASGSDGAFPSAKPGALLGIIPEKGSRGVGSPVSASGGLFDDSDSDDQIPAGKLRADTKVQSSTFGGLRNKRRSRSAVSPRGKGIPLGALVAAGVVLVLAISGGVAVYLRSSARAEAKRFFLAAVEEKPAEEALAIGEELDENLKIEDAEVASAIDTLRDVVAAAKRRAEAEALLARINEVAKLEERLGLCNQAVEVDETYYQAFVQRARVKYALAKREALDKAGAGSKVVTQAALDDLRKAIVCDPDVPGPYYVRADILLESGKDLDSRNLARQDLKRAINMAPGTALAALAEGRRAALERKLSKAIEFYDEAISKDPRLLGAYLARAETRLVQADFAGALRDASQACDSDANSARGLTLRAHARFHANNDRAGALLDLDKALVLDPTLGAAMAIRAYVRLERSGTGQLKSKESEIKLAEKDAERALLLDATLPLAHMANAEILWKRRELSPAISSASKALKHSFRSAEAHLLIARLRTQDGDHDQAFHDLDKVLQLEPDNARALTLKAQILTRRRDFSQAQSLLERALEIDRNLPQAFFSRALLNLNARRPNPRKAIEDLSEAVGLQPDFSDAYFYRAAAYHDTGRFEDAINDLDQALELRKTVSGAFSIADVHLIRGHCHYLREDWEEALASYQLYLKLAPVGSTATQNVRNRKRECERKLAGN